MQRQKIIESDLITVRAGNIAHLKSKFLFETSSPILELAKKLHPTPELADILPKNQLNQLRKMNHIKEVYTAGF